MCMAAIYGAKIEAVFFCNTERDALAYGFVEKLILEELRKAPKDRRIRSTRLVNDRGLVVFEKAKAMGVGKGGE